MQICVKFQVTMNIISRGFNINMKKKGGSHKENIGHGTLLILV